MHLSRKVFLTKHCEQNFASLIYVVNQFDSKRGNKTAIENVKAQLFSCFLVFLFLSQSSNIWCDAEKALYCFTNICAKIYLYLKADNCFLLLYICAKYCVPKKLGKLSMKTDHCVLVPCFQVSQHGERKSAAN